MRDLNNCHWVQVTSAAHHDDIIKRVRAQGSYVGPGRYLMLRYSQPCLRGCCYDDVIELVPAAEAVEEVRGKMRDLATILREARQR